MGMLVFFCLIMFSKTQKMIDCLIKCATIVTPPPYLAPLPDMATYGHLGSRMLSSSSYKGKCFQCTWATMSAINMRSSL